MSRTPHATDPLQQLATHWRHARTKKDPVADAVSLATCESQQPNVRTILLKKIDARGVHFVTQSLGEKGQHLASKPLAQICCHWPSLALQARVHGRVKPMPAEEVTAWWFQRDRDAQLLYWLSVPQSVPIPSFAHLTKAIAELRQFTRAYEIIPPTPSYVGYIIEPQWIEILKYGGKSRMSERTRYTKKSGQWCAECLAP